MAHSENTIVINKPTSIVYDFLADGLNTKKWRPGVIDISLASGEVGKVGAIYKQVLRGPGGRNIDGDYRIVTANPSSELAFEVIAGPARPTGVYYLESEGEGTKLRFVLDFQPKGLAKLMNSMIQKTMESEVSQLTALKSVIETQDPV